MSLCARSVTARSGHYVVVAGPQHALLEITADGAVVTSHVLRAKSHRQPEGLTFVGDSVALLADEGGGKGDGKNGGKNGGKGGVLTVYRRAP
jgi:hypothetical protein